VQAFALRVFAREMLEAGQVDAEAMLAMGALAARFAPTCRRSPGIARCCGISIRRGLRPTCYGCDRG
jgi:hypothetical protein